MNEIDKCTAMLKAWTLKLEEFRLRNWLRSEPAMLPKWTHPPRSFKSLPDGQVIVQGREHSVRTTYLRRDYNANDVALLEKIVQAQPKVFTFEQITAGRKFKAGSDQIERIRKGKF